MVWLRTGPSNVRWLTGSRFHRATIDTPATAYEGHGCSGRAQNLPATLMIKDIERTGAIASKSK